MRVGNLLLCGVLFTVMGCATVNREDFEAEGAKASAFCTTGGPGGTLGLGPSGIVAGAKVNDDFTGIIGIEKDCSITIKAE